jgi:hypothetical protein
MSARREAAVRFDTKATKDSKTTKGSISPCHGRATAAEILVVLESLVSWCFNRDVAGAPSSEDESHGIKNAAPGEDRSGVLAGVFPESAVRLSGDCVWSRGLDPRLV